MHFLFTEQVVLETLQLTLIILDVREDAELFVRNGPQTRGVTY